MTAERVEITPEQLAELSRRKGSDFVTSIVEAEGTAVIRDKDGNVKGKLRLFDLNRNEDG